MLHYDLLREELVNLLVKTRKTLLIPHWDVDGLASTSILREYLESLRVELEVYIPEIGVYSWKSIKRSLEGVDALILVDYALKTEDIRVLEDQYDVRVLLVDHHINVLPKSKKYVNPYLHGLGVYPSTTLVLKELLGIDWNLRVALGVVGDLGDRVWDSRVRREFEEFLKSNSWDYSRVYKLAEMVDSAYKIGDKKLVRDSIDKLSKYSEDLDSALEDKEWSRAYEEVKVEVEELTSKARGELVDDKILVYKLKSNYYVASSLGRRLALLNPDKIVVLAFETTTSNVKQVYVRSRAYNLEEPLKRLRSLGLNVGGKREVFSIQLEGGREFEEVLSPLIDVLRREVKC